VRPDEERTVQLNIRIKPELRRQIRQFCLDKDLDIKQFVALALELGLRKDLSRAEGRGRTGVLKVNGLRRSSA